MQVSRLDELKHWLAALDGYVWDFASLAPASSDASFRRYFRIQGQHATGPNTTYVVMDAPPDKEPIAPFVAVAERMRAASVKVPHILAQDASLGFVLLDDFGNHTFLACIQHQTIDADAAYQVALADLAAMQANTAYDGLPQYDANRLTQEMDLFELWFVQKHCAQILTDAEHNAWGRMKSLLLASALAQAPVFVHRDYHSRNLMVLSGLQSDDYAKTPALQSSIRLGMLDFQDAVSGPASYDVVSLLRDAYIEWPEEQALDWAIRYWHQAKSLGVPVASDPAQFYQDLDWMGLQRHLKVLGIFARLHHRDGKSQYLNDLPLVLRYVRLVAGRYSAFTPLLRLLDRLEGQQAQVAYTF